MTELVNAQRRLILTRALGDEMRLRRGLGSENYQYFSGRVAHWENEVARLSTAPDDNQVSQP